MADMVGLQNERRCDAGSGELAELGSCGKAPAHAKAQRMRGDIAEIARKVFAIDGMSLVFTIAYTDVL